MIARTPVIVARTAARVPLAGESVRILGFDSGLANLGLTVVSATPSPERYVCLHAEFLATKKADKKARQKIRVSVDDAQRLEVIYDRIAELATQYKVHGIAAEAFTPNPNQRGVGAWKAAMAYALALAFARSRNLAFMTNLPADIKRPFGGTISATKEAVAEALCARVEGFATQLNKIAKGNREHVSDAGAHGVLGAQEMFRIRRMMGVGR